MKNRIVVDTLTSVCIEEALKNGGDMLEVYEAFFCQNLDFDPYAEIVNNVRGKK